MINNNSFFNSNTQTFNIPKIKGNIDNSQNLFIKEFLISQNKSLEAENILSDKLMKTILFSLKNGKTEIEVIGEFHLTNDKKGVFSEVSNQIFEISLPLFNKYGKLFTEREVKGKFKITYSSEENKLFVIDFNSLEFEANLQDWANYRNTLSMSSWLKIIFTAIGLDYSQFLFRERIIILSRFLPLLTKNFSFLELGPKSLGKSHLYGLFSENVTIKTSNSSPSSASIIFNKKDNIVGSIFKTETLVFDEFNTKALSSDLFSELQTYLSSQKIMRDDKKQYFLDTSIVFLGNTPKIDYRTIFRASTPSLIDEIKLGIDPTAMLDRINYLNPSWGMRRILSNHILTPDFKTHNEYIPLGYLSKIITQLRNIEFDAKSYLSEYGYDFKNFDKRSSDSIYKSFSGFLKLIFPHVAIDQSVKLDKSDLDMILFFACEGRVVINNILNKKDSLQFKKFELTDIFNFKIVDILKYSFLRFYDAELMYLPIFYFESPHLIKSYIIGSDKTFVDKLSLDNIGVEELGIDKITNPLTRIDPNWLRNNNFANNQYPSYFYELYYYDTYKKAHCSSNNIFIPIENPNLNHLYGYLLPIFPDLLCTINDWNNNIKFYSHNNYIFKNEKSFYCPNCNESYLKLKFINYESFCCLNCNKKYDSYTLKEII